MASIKQQKANQQNAKLGGVKTEAGKAVSKYNAQKHGILRQAATEYEAEARQGIMQELEEQLQPVGIVETLLVERVAVHYIKLFRIQRAETEYMKSQLDPRQVHVEGGFQLLSIGEPEVVVVDNQGYTSKITGEDMEHMANSFGRYETSVENKLYKALHELERIQRLRNGDNIQAPAAVEVTIGSFGKTEAEER